MVLVILGILLSLASVVTGGVLMFYFDYNAPILSGYICYIVTFLLFSLLSFAFYKVAQRKYEDMKRHGVIDILLIINKVVRYVFYGLLGLAVLVYSVLLPIKYPAITRATEATTATVLDRVSSDRSYLILSFVTNDGDEIRATIQVTSSSSYIKGDKVSIRYNALNPEEVQSANITVDSPLTNIGLSTWDPPIVEGDE